MDDLLTRLDLFLRGGAVTALVICAVIFLASRSRTSEKLSVSALCLGLSAYLLVSSPNLGLAGTWMQPWLVAVAGVVPILAVWAGVEIFLDRPLYRPWHGAIAAAVAAGAWLAPVFPIAGTLRGALVFLLYAGLLYIALSTAAADLVESRRRFRRWFVAVMALSGLAISMVEIFQLDTDMPNLVYPLHASGFLVLTIAFLCWATRLAPDLYSPTDHSQPRPAASLPAADVAVLTRVEAAIAAGIWQQEGLSIAQLAATVDAPEHRVRRAINKGLGYRNFAQFINERRIEAARQILSDPARADMPILSIAYEVGFASVGPFNRAFRDQTGQSPSEYRQSRTTLS